MLVIPNPTLTHVTVITGRVCWLFTRVFFGGFSVESYVHTVRSVTSQAQDLIVVATQVDEPLVWSTGSTQVGGVAGW